MEYHYLHSMYLVERDITKDNGTMGIQMDMVDSILKTECIIKGSLREDKQLVMTVCLCIQMDLIKEDKWLMEKWREQDNFFIKATN